MIQIAHTLKDVHQLSLDLADSKTILEILYKHYPGYTWLVKVDKGRVSIKNLETSGEEGFALNFDKHQWSASQFENAIVMAGGEVLERFGLRRGSLNPQQVAELKVDRLGAVLQV